jgi:hypothetical protein
MIENANVNSKETKKYKDLNIVNHSLNLISYILSFLCFIGIIYLLMNCDQFWNERKYLMPDNYRIPSILDFFACLYIIPIISFIKVVFNKLFYPISLNYLLSSKYKNPNDPENYKMKDIFAQKLTTNFFKATYFIIIVVFAYYSCKDANYFPYELGGNGDIMNSFNQGLKYFIYYDKPAYLDIYYLISLSYVLSDFIWLLFIYESQSDFPIMILHHIVTIALIGFSYLVNISQLGVVVLFCHDFTDIFVYITRIIINTDLKDKYKLTFCSLFLFIYLYTRIYVFGKVFYLETIYANEWSLFLSTLWYFQIILLIMHGYWLYQIIIRFFHLSITDVGQVNKKNN